MERKGILGLKPISKISTTPSAASDVSGVHIKKLPVYRYVSKERIKVRESQGWVRVKEGEVDKSMVIENDDSVLMKKV